MGQNERKSQTIHIPNDKDDVLTLYSMLEDSVDFNCWDTGVWFISMVFKCVSLDCTSRRASAP